MIRLGLTQRVVELPVRGERRDCLDQAWTPLLLRHGFLPVPLPNQTTDAVAMVDGMGIQGFVLTGGNDLTTVPGGVDTAPERDAFEHMLVDLATERGLPVLGVCRGLQMLVVHHGGHLTPVEGHVARRHGLVPANSTSLPLSPRAEVNSFHNFGVVPDGLGPVLLAEATAPDGSIEALRHPSLPQWGIMWHPERDPRDPRDVELFDALFKEGRS